MKTRSNSSVQYKELELNVLRIAYLISAILSPIATYSLLGLKMGSFNSQFMGWFFSALFVTVIILSFINTTFKKHFIKISFIIFILGCLDALYFAAGNELNNSYTMLFFLVLLATTVFMEKRTHLVLFHTIVFSILVPVVFLVKADSNMRRIMILIVYIIIAFITFISSSIVQKKQEKINLLVSIIESINQSNSFDEILSFIHSSFTTFIPYMYIGIALIKENGTILEASYGISDGNIDGLPQKLFGMRVKLADTSLQEILYTGKARIINNLEEYVKIREMKDYTKIILECGIRSSISLPLFVNSRPVGIIFFSSKNKNAYTNDHVKFLKMMASSIGISFEKCILFENLILSNIMSLVKLSEFRDGATGEHLDRINLYVKLLAQKLYENSKYSCEITPQYLSDIEKFAPMHDIGKVGIRDGILLKPGKLTIDEFEEMKKHTVYGGEVLRLVENNILRVEKGLYKIGIEIIEGHHEKWDGTGYPYGKSGVDIPLSARIVAVADVFDALTNERPYKEAFPFDKSFQIILDGSGKQFDPEIVRIFDENKTGVFEIYDSFRLSKLYH